MAVYAIGDIHGCMKALSELLEAISWQPGTDALWFVGDLVNGGPDSLAVLRWMVAHKEHVTVVLGNHDLHMLAVADGVKQARKSDTFQDIFDAPDKEDLLDWLRRRPMMHRQGNHVMVHAGLLPPWTMEEAQGLARDIESVLRGPQKGRVAFFDAMYGNEPRRWRGDLMGADRLRLGINAMTRMRIVGEVDLALEFDFKGELGDVPEGYVAWFDAARPAQQGLTVLCGHWSALGLVMREDLIALDTGCVWGRHLTAVRIEDRQIFQVQCSRN